MNVSRLPSHFPGPSCMLCQYPSPDIPLGQLKLSEIFYGPPACSDAPSCQHPRSSDRDCGCHSSRWGRVAAIRADLKGAGGIKTALKGQVSARCVRATGGAGPPVPSRRQPAPAQPTRVPCCWARPHRLFPTEGTEGTRSWSLVQAGQSLLQLLLKIPPRG